MAGKDSTADEQKPVDFAQELSPPSQRWGLVQEYARTPGRKLLRTLANVRRASRSVTGPAGSPTIVPFIGCGSCRFSCVLMERVMDNSPRPQLWRVSAGDASRQARIRYAQSAGSASGSRFRIHHCDASGRRRTACYDRALMLVRRGIA
jgi:hypothetical protein